MKPTVIFDSFQTLVKKDGIEEAVQTFLKKKLKIGISKKQITDAFYVQYCRTKFNHPRFRSAADRQQYYITYNQQLCALLGVSISAAAAVELNKKLSALPYQVYSDVKPTLQALQKRGVALGLLANWTTRLDLVLGRAGLKKYFAFIHSSEALGVQKPDPRFFKRGISGPINRTMYYIGDDYELDIQSAQRAGLTPILIDRQNRYQNADCTRVTTLKDILRIIK